METKNRNMTENRRVWKINKQYDKSSGDAGRHGERGQKELRLVEREKRANFTSWTS